MQQLPFLKILIPFILGLLLQQLVYIDYQIDNAFWITLSIVFVFLISSFLLKPFIQYRIPWLSGTLLFILITYFGFYLSSLQLKTTHANHYSKVINDSSLVQATLLQPITKKTKSYKTHINITQVQNGKLNYNTQGEVLCYFTKTDSFPKLKPGDQILFQANMLPIKNNGNIAEFDYKAYCANKEILHNCFVSPYQYIKLPTNINTLNLKAANWRIATIKIIKKYITNPKAFGIAEALLIGDRTDIDQETWDSYSRTGIVHIIAISGMHMGIIYLGILTLLNLIPFFKKNNYIPICIAVISMWLFACVTGLPASVMRAAVMFTILAIGSLLKRNSDGFNTLLVSAFILLAYNTRWIQDVGFQLSYAAVLGIMLFAKPIQNLLYVQSKPALGIWKLISGTLAAQIFTFPLCLYYFHQFPLIFLISNIIAIPLTSIILYAEIILLICTLLSNWLCIILGKIITAIILFLNASIYWLSTFEHITIYNVHCNLWQTLLLFGFVCIGIYAVRKRGFYAAIASISTIIMFYTLQLSYAFKASTQKQLIVYNVPKKTILGYFSGNAHQLFSLQEIKASDIKNAVEPGLIKNFATINNSKLLSTYRADSTYLLAFNQTQNWLVLGKHVDTILRSIPCKYVILTQNSNASLQQIKGQCSPEYIIADGSNAMWKIEQWQKDAKDLHLQFFSTQLHGAFVAKL
jgi:competence protein ComEC